MTVSMEERKFTRFVRDTVKCRVRNLPYSVEPEDIAQDVMFDLWRKYGDEWMGHAGCSFVFFAVKRRAVDAVRRVCGRYKGKQAEFVYCDPPGEQVTFISPEGYSRLVDAAARPDAHSDIASAVLVDGVKGREVARMVGVTEGRVSQLVSKIRARAFDECLDV